MRGTDLLATRWLTDTGEAVEVVAVCEQPTAEVLYNDGRRHSVTQDILCSRYIPLTVPGATETPNGNPVTPEIETAIRRIVREEFAGLARRGRLS